MNIRVSVVGFVMAIGLMRASTVENGYLWLLGTSQFPVAIDSAKEKVIRDGVTLGELTKVLGPAWVRPDEGIGYIFWVFTDGRRLTVLPGRYEKSEVITRHGLNGRSKMWWKPD